MRRAHRWPFVLAGVIVAALAVLAKMQIDRIEQLSQNREQRERAELEGATRRFGGEIDFEVFRIGGMFEVGGDVNELAERYERWRTLAADTRLLGAIYVVTPESLSRFDPEQRTLKSAALPPEIAEAVARSEFPQRFVQEIPALTFQIREHPRELLILQIDMGYLARTHAAAGAGDLRRGLRRRGRARRPAGLPQRSAVVGSGARRRGAAVPDARAPPRARRPAARG